MEQINLTGKELSKLADIIDVPENILRKINELNLLSSSYVRRVVIRSDFERVSAMKQYTKQQIMKAIAIEYNMTASNVETIIYNKKTNVKKYCQSCGNTVTSYKFTKNKGLCDECLSKKLTDVL